MQTVTNKQPSDRMNTHELLRDYMNKINAACPLALVHHEQDAQGATLVVHVPAGNVAESAALAKLGERLTKLANSLPAPPPSEPYPTGGENTEEIDESQKAVVSPLAKARKPRKPAKTDEQSSVESGGEVSP